MGELASAWLLELGSERYAAVGKTELQEVMAQPSLTAIPAAPAYCRYRVGWRGLELPVLDLAVIFGAAPDPAPPHWLTVAAYREPTGQPRFGAIQLAAPPSLIEVSDDSACPIPETSLTEYLAYSFLAHCCFRHQGRAVPILNVPRLFSPQARQRLARYSTPPAIRSARHLEGAT